MRQSIQPNEGNVNLTIKIIHLLQKRYIILVSVLANRNIHTIPLTRTFSSPLDVSVSTGGINSDSISTFSSINLNSSGRLPG